MTQKLSGHSMELGVQAEVLHVNELIKRKNLLDYHVLVFPGGFSFGDYVRSGVIFARHLSAKLGKEMKAFIDEGRPILGICNGFQILVEYGLLPGFEGMSTYPEATLTTNEPAGFKCQWVYLKTRKQGQMRLHKQNLQLANCAGCLLLMEKAGCCFPKRKKTKCSAKLIDEDMVVFRYCSENGEAADGEVPD